LIYYCCCFLPPSLAIFQSYCGVKYSLYILNNNDEISVKTLYMLKLSGDKQLKSLDEKVILFIVILYLNWVSLSKFK
jgi:hypothetical protein